MLFRSFEIASFSEAVDSLLKFLGRAFLPPALAGFAGKSRVRGPKILAILSWI
jgi:hypothetical protein